MLCRICAKTFAKTPCSGAQNGATSLQKSPKDYRNCSRLDSGDIKYTIVFNKYLQYVEFFMPMPARLTGSIVFLLLSRHSFVCAFANLWTWYFAKKNEWTDCVVNWHESSTGQGRLDPLLQGSNISSICGCCSAEAALHCVSLRPELFVVSGFSLTVYLQLGLWLLSLCEWCKGSVGLTCVAWRSTDMSGLRRLCSCITLSSLTWSPAR